ncbi:MAG: hypothetical protein JST85_13395 [Acidobacteria bacterium]|nr:hypothetical protein [Acidobacteriota bacterium]
MIGAGDYQTVLEVSERIEVARRGKEDKDTLPILKERATKDSSPASDAERWESGVRDAAIRSLARGWPDDPDTLALLRERAKNDPTPWLREKAQQLADQIEARKKHSD